MPMNWYIVGNTWKRCEIVSRGLFGGLVTVRLYDGSEATGRERKGLYGALIEP